MGNTVPDNYIHPTVKYERHCSRYIHTGRQKLPSSHYGRHCSRQCLRFRNTNVPTCVYQKRPVSIEAMLQT